MLSRRNVTQALLSAISTQTSCPVGDSTAPDPPFGWDGQPGAVGSKFTPYSVLTPMSSSRASGPMSDTHADWQLNYSLSSIGTTREQCEWICDKARSSFITLKNTTVDGVDGTYKIQQIRTESIGGIVKSESVEPHMFGQTDVFSVWVSKGL